MNLYTWNRVISHNIDVLYPNIKSFWLLVSGSLSDQGKNIFDAEIILLFY